MKFQYCLIRPSVLVTNTKKRTSSTEEIEIKKPKIEPVFKKTALEEVQEVISFSLIIYKQKNFFQMEEKLKEQKNRKDYWLHEVRGDRTNPKTSFLSFQGIIVKVITSRLGEKYYKKKGMVIKVENRYQAIIKMLDTNDKIRIDQAHVETVIPAIGKKVLVVNGAYRGQQAILEDIHQNTYSVDITLLTVRLIRTFSY
jgi:DNA/RNA-binding protein KIN17